MPLDLGLVASIASIIGAVVSVIAASRAASEASLLRSVLPRISALDEVTDGLEERVTRVSKRVSAAHARHVRLGEAEEQPELGLPATKDELRRRIGLAARG